ncbi:MAG: hydrogenase iron-sulfur subunit [Candidatus Dadabacteria bacterium]|nr:MAG: hydrogenase iron-sulfur subunit [Candidatus Dadabacteria bacterium]
MTNSRHSPHPGPPQWTRKPGLSETVDRLLRPLDWLFNRLSGSALNPLYQTGTVGVVAFVVLLVTGIYLFIFYETDAPWASVQVISAAPFGAWIRRTHRYAADVFVVAVVLHAIKMFASGKFWGPRSWAWRTGVMLLGALVLCGVSGFWLVWDALAQHTALAAAQMIDPLHVLPQSLASFFAGLDPVPRSFFFALLFVHVCLPLGLMLLLMMHLLRLSKPPLWPPRPLLLGAVIGLGIAAAVLPLPQVPEASVLRIWSKLPLDWLYLFWVPAAHGGAGMLWLLSLGTTALLLAVPKWFAPKQDIPVSTLDSNLCTGCATCYEDCPYTAITMIPRPNPDPRKSPLVSSIDPLKCVGCGVCAGSCAPMSVGPPARRGRDQLALLQEAWQTVAATPPRIVVFACRNGVEPALSDDKLPPNTWIWSADCTGSVHAAMVEFVLRQGASGVCIATCPSRDAGCRLGPNLVRDRMLHGREAELRPTVDVRRLSIVDAARTEPDVVRAAIMELESVIDNLDNADLRELREWDPTCEPADPDEVLAR